MNLFIKVPWALLFQDEQARSGANTGANGAQVDGQVLRAGKYVEQMERSFRAPPNAATLSVARGFFSCYVSNPRMVPDSS